MDLDWLHDFSALADAGSFTRAADARHVTQPAFSRRVRALEEWVGAPLFARTAQGSRLTPAGERFNADVPGLLRTLETLRREAREAGEPQSATLRFAATHALSFTFFPQWLRAIEHQTPTASIQLLSDTMQACEGLMREGRANFLLCHHHGAASGSMREPAYCAVDVGEDRLVPYARVRAPTVPAWTLGVDADVPMLAYSEESGLARILAAQDLRQRCPALREVFSARLASTLLGMVRQGDGVAWLPESLARDCVESGEIAAAGGADWIVPMSVRLFRVARPQGPAVERFWKKATAA